MLEIKNIDVEVNGIKILKNISLTINKGEVHAIMGPNGAGKSTLSNTIMGHPSYKVTKGNIYFNNIDITTLPTDERARLGLFLVMQYPSEVEGVLNSDFLRTAINSRREEPINLFEFIMQYEKSAKEVGMNDELSKRYLNVGFSGGEKKRNEILQLLMLKPSIAIVDEIDSGLDVDALKVVGENLAKQTKENNLGSIIITHYDRIFDYIKPTHVHILKDGFFIKEGNYKLVEKINQEGFDWLNE